MGRLWRGDFGRGKPIEDILVLIVGVRGSGVDHSESQVEIYSTLVRFIVAVVFSGADRPWAEFYFQFVFMGALMVIQNT